MDSTAPFSGMDLRCGRIDGRTDNVVRGCALGLRRRRRRRSKRSTHNENVGAGYCRRQSLSLSWSSLPLYGFVSSALLPTAILREYVAIEATFIRVAPVSYILKRFDFATSRFWESAPKHLYDISGLALLSSLRGRHFACMLVHFRNFPHYLDGF